MCGVCLVRKIAKIVTALEIRAKMSGGNLMKAN
jgi:hypothetical protein